MDVNGISAHEKKTNYAVGGTAEQRSRSFVS